MEHNLKISVTKNPRNGGVVTVRHVTIRERFLRLLLGRPLRLTVIVPGTSVDTIAINEVLEGGAGCEALRG